MVLGILGPASPFRGGISQFLHNLADSLSSQNEVIVFNFIHQYPRILFPGKNQTELLDKKHNYPIYRVLTPYNPLTWEKTAKSIINHKITHLIIKFWIPFFCPAYTYIIDYLKKHTNIKISVLCHNIEFHEKWFFAECLVKRMLRSVDEVIVLSENVAAQAEKLVLKKKIIKLFHPIYDVDIFKYHRDESLQFLQLPDKPTVLFVGYIKPYKGLDILLQSIPVVHQTNPEILFVVAGEIYAKINKYKDFLDHRYPHIIFRNQYISLEEIPHYLNIADVVVVPYRTASQSGIVQIAYSYLKPIIASNIPGLQEMVIENQTGFLFQSEDEKDLAEKIIRFFAEKGNIDFKSNIKENNKNYSWEKFASQLSISHHPKPYL